MRTILLILCLLLFHNNAKTQDWVLEQEFSTDYQTISYSQFLNLVEEETDTVFRLKHVIVKYDPNTDNRLSYNNDFDQSRQQPGAKQETERIVVNKYLKLYNVHFLTERKRTESGFIIYGNLKDIHFKKPIWIQSSISTSFVNCIFDEAVRISTTNGSGHLENLSLYFDNYNWAGIAFINNTFHQNVRAEYTGIGMETELSATINFSRNNFIKRPANPLKEAEVYLFGRNIFSVGMSYNYFKDYDELMFNDIENASHNFSRNQLENTVSEINITGSRGFDNMTIIQNTFDSPILLSIDKLNPTNQIDYSQFNNQIISRNGWYYAESEVFNTFGTLIRSQRDSLLQVFKNETRYKHKYLFEEELGLRGVFYNHYNSKFNSDEANIVYVDIKDIETEKLKYQYLENPDFETFFTFKINQFLRVFSAYGTKPAKAIIFSVYVILAFAIVYLFYPNYWDSHGKNRIVDRYSFFLKYMKRDAGMQDVYLEDKKSEILAYQDYKELIESSGKNVPKFFQVTALPMYKWAISGTKLTASLLSKVDVMKGTWSDLPQSKRVWKSVLLISVFLIALLYDIFIKMLNALMLSINTFTTLGFGEIPIKGLPRYLAIIQGFIGWFMLTIFSVSLISQLLN